MGVEITGNFFGSKKSLGPFVKSSATTDAKVPGICITNLVTPHPQNKPEPILIRSLL